MSEAMALGALELTEPERLLLDTLSRGQPADLKGKAVRGQVLRDLLLEAHPGWRLPPGGVRIHRAVITGGLDLEGCILTRPLLIWHSRIEGSDRGALLIRDARVKRIGIHSSTIDAGIVADRVHLEGGFFLGGGLVRGTLSVRGADVTGAMVIEGTEIGNGKVAVQANGLKLSGPMYLRAARVKGEVAFKRAILGTGLYAERAEIISEGRAIDGESARIAGDILLDDAKLTGGVLLANVELSGRITADRATVLPAAGETAATDAIDASGVNIGQSLSLAGAKLGGTLDLEGARIGKSFIAEGIEIDGGSSAIVADVISIGGNWDLARARLVGQVSCPGADIRGQLRLTEARLYGSDLAIRADGAQIRGGCFMSRAIVLGLVRLPAATIGNQFRLRGASLKVERGAALIASGSSFARDVELNGGLQTVGAVVLDQARIRGVLDLRQSSIRSAAVARGGQPLPEALRQDDGHTALADEAALSLVDADIDRLLMPETQEHRPRGVVDLSRAHAGAFEDHASAWVPAAAARTRSPDGRDIDHLVLDGFSYDYLTNPSGAPSDGHGGTTSHNHHDDRVGENRIHWLQGQAACDLEEHFKPQAWVQLAARLAAQGYHEDARTISIARRRRERRSHSTTAGHRWQDRFLDLFALYGYNPWRTVLWIAGFVLLFAGVWASAAGHCQKAGCLDESVFVVANRDAYTQDGFERRYPPFHALGYSLDAFIPFVPLGYEDHWRPNTAWMPLAEIPLPAFAAALANNPPAQGKRGADAPHLVVTGGALLYLLWLAETVIGLVLTSLAITGFTGLLRSDQ